MEQENLPAPIGGSSALAEGTPMRRFTFADPDYADDEAGGGSGGLKRILAAVLYYKWLVLAVVLVGMAAGVAASRYVEPEYTSQARLWVAVASREGDLEGPIQSAELLQGGAWLELLGSYAVLDHVVNDQRLYLEYRARDRDVLADLTTDSVFTP
ncbi:MAG TPA: Wzz/FepE/Etk N-terminal domain-containing protein, partial [Thiobacillaceae bacterium]